MVACVEEKNATQASLPLDAAEHGRHLFPRLAPEVHDDQLVDHADILKTLAFSIVIGLS